MQFGITSHLICVHRLLELSPGQKIIEQARQVLTACDKAPADAIKINYDPRNPFDIDCINFLPIYKGSKYAEDPYTGEPTGFITIQRFFYLSWQCRQPSLVKCCFSAWSNPSRYPAQPGLSSLSRSPAQ